MSEHAWAHVYFSKFTWCTFCEDFIWGVTKKQGYQCRVCKADSHGKCRANAGPCPGLDYHKDKKKKNKKSASGKPKPQRTTPAPPPKTDSSANLYKAAPPTNTAAPIPAANEPAPSPEASEQADDDGEEVHQARALFDFPPENARELALKKGDVVEILKVDAEWWFGVLPDGSEGYFPGNYVEKIGTW
eukprot:TRINITY_DN1006_c0_g2_i1.p1 TRINITY_DN1006_c0_g2~~TRINITY_DN1006_c0_g2_i1.p1  ORF type:complete len:188 (-),score=35.95 TRINITY_DN1006_c0_g2_i1:35-598(-)